MQMTQGVGAALHNLSGPSHSHLPPELLGNGSFFFFAPLTVVLVVEYTVIWIISTSVSMYITRLQHSILFPCLPLCL